MAQDERIPELGKPKGRHPENRLNAAAVKRAGPGRHADGNGLYLEVSNSGARRWILRTVVHGRRRDIGLGGVSLVGLAEARQKAAELRKVAREGGDPVAERDKGRYEPVTFEAAARHVFETQIEPVAKKGRHVPQWLRSLERDAFPVIGSLPVHAIGQPEVLRVLAPIWTEKPETARRVRRRMREVLEWATAAGHREGENPVDRVKAGAGLAKHRDRQKHFAALPWQEMPAIWPRLLDCEGMGAAALRFQILTATRSGEVRGAIWSEIAMDEAVWTIPEERLKSGREHRIPLSAVALSELQAMEVFSRGETSQVFPSRRGGPLSENTLSIVLRKRLKVDATPHGFRSSFRDWAEERARARYEVAEAALAHRTENKVERAYRRGDLFEQRRSLMDLWARFVTGDDAEVVQLHRGAWS